MPIIPDWRVGERVQNQTERMMQDIEMEVRHTRTTSRRDALAPEIMQAMEKVP